MLTYASSSRLGTKPCYTDHSAVLGYLEAAQQFTYKVPHVLTMMERFSYLAPPFNHSTLTQRLKDNNGSIYLCSCDLCSSAGRRSSRCHYYMLSNGTYLVRKSTTRRFPTYHQRLLGIHGRKHCSIGSVAECQSPQPFNIRHSSAS